MSRADLYIIFAITILAASLVLGRAEQNSFVKMDLAALPVDTELPSSQIDEILPIMVPTLSAHGDQSSVNVRQGFSKSGIQFEDDAKPYLVMQKSSGDPHVGLAFSMPGTNSILPEGQLTLRMKFWLGSGGTGNIVVAFKSGNDTVSYIQIVADGTIQLINPEDDIVADLGRIQLDQPVDLQYILNFETGRAVVKLAGETMGEGNGFATGKPVRGLVFAVSGETCKSLSAFQEITLEQTF